MCWLLPSPSVRMRDLLRCCRFQASRRQRPAVPSQKHPSDTVSTMQSAMSTQKGQSDSVSTIQCLDKSVADIRKKWQDVHLVANSMSIGVAGGWRFAQSQLGQMNPLGWSAWATSALAKPSFSDHLKLLLQLQYDNRLAIDTVKATSLLSFGSRLVVTTSAFNLFAEDVWTHPMTASTPAQARSVVNGRRVQGWKLVLDLYRRGEAIRIA